MNVSGMTCDAAAIAADSTATLLYKRNIERGHPFKYETVCFDMPTMMSKLLFKNPVEMCLQNWRYMASYGAATAELISVASAFDDDACQG